MAQGTRQAGWLLVLVGLGAGVVGGGLGVGGGIILVPLLVAIGFDRHRAHATSLAAIVLISAAGATSFAVDGEIDVVLGLDRIKSLVVKLQTFSRLDDGRNQAVNVAAAIDTVLTILHHRIPEHVQVTTEFGAPEVIQCQSSLINQCVMNLIVNAIDAIEPREAAGCVHISARAEGDSYVIRVVDNGPGIPPDIASRIFDPFFTTKPEGKGTGLGLSIAAGVVEKHDGTLALLPADGGGTAAVARLPLGRVTANVRAAATSA